MHYSPTADTPPPNSQPMPCHVSIYTYVPSSADAPIPLPCFKTYNAVIHRTVTFRFHPFGLLADTQYVAGVVEAKLDAYRTQFGRDPAVRAAATVTRNLCYANKGGISASFICAGWDARVHIFL